MEAAGKLTFPAIAANDALCKHLFDNRYGTGQSTLAAIDRLTNLNFAGREFCIVGYGWVGKGLARAARGAGGRVTVVEIDPVAALEAHMDGNRVARLEDALPDADVLISATGAIDCVPREALAHLKDGVLIANGGHHEREVAIDGLGPGRGGAARRHRARSRWRSPRLRARGGPPDERRRRRRPPGRDHGPLLLACKHSPRTCSRAAVSSRGCTPFPDELDREIARTKLATLGLELAEPTAKQRAFSEGWRV